MLKFFAITVTREISEKLKQRPPMTMKDMYMLKNNKIYFIWNKIVWLIIYRLYTFQINVYRQKVRWSFSVLNSFIIIMRKSCKPWTVRHFQNIFMLKVLFLFEAVKFILF